MVSKTTLLLLGLAFTTGVALYFILGTREPFKTAMKPFVAPFNGVAEFVETKVGSFITTLKQNPWALFSAGGLSAGFFVLTLANKAYNSAKTKIQSAASSVVQQSQEQALSAQTDAVAALKENEELRKKLEIYETEGSVVEKFTTLNKDLQAKLDRITAERDQLRTQYGLLQTEHEKLFGKIKVETPIP